MIGAGLIFWTLFFQQVRRFKVVCCGFLYVSITLMPGLMAVVYISWWGILYSIVISGLIIYWVNQLPETLRVRYRWAGIAILLTAFCSMLVVESIKPIWGRVRFRSMQDNLNLFTSWYQINGDKYLSAVSLKEEIKSFPSGHSQWAGTTLSLSFLTLVDPRLKDKENLFFLGTLLYAVVVVISRMMQGAHFLTDVTVGFSAAFLFFLLFHHLLQKKLRENYLLKYI